mgnify:CR=1 FL=1
MEKRIVTEEVMEALREALEAYGKKYGYEERPEDFQILVESYETYVTNVEEAKELTQKELVERAMALWEWRS